MVEKKPTKRENFIKIIEVLKESGRDDLVKVIDHEIELLDKKSASGKMTKTQLENADIKEMILSALEQIGEPVTITDLLAKSPELAKKTNNSNQKVSALVTQLKEDKLVVRTQVGKKAVFSLAEEE